MKKYAIIDYLDIDNRSDTKSEYVNGHILSMAGGTLNHGIIGNNINTEINNGIRRQGKACTSINGEVKIYIQKANSFLYPDGMVVCGNVDVSDVDKHSVTNPLLIIEVLSKSTESNDRGDKFHKYCSLPSFCEYLLIDQYKPLIDTLYRKDGTSWKMITTIGLEKSIYLDSLDLEIKMTDIYRNTVNLDNPKFRLDF